MYCRNCGNKVADGAKFCTKCGSVLEAAMRFQSAPVAVLKEDAPKEKEEDSALIEEKNEAAKQVLTPAIVGLALSELGLPGLIVSLVARSRLKKFVAKYGKASGKAAIGKGLSIGGLAASIYFMVFWAIYILYFVIYIGIYAAVFSALGGF